MATAYTLEFEKPLQELDRQIADLRRSSTERGSDLTEEITALEAKLAAQRDEIYRNLSPIQRVMVARHPRRPYTLDYLSTIFTDFIELHGDRLFRDDPAIVGGWARLGGQSVMVIGHQKGRDTKDNLRRNFGMPHPEGYRKALRLMKLAARFGAPVITLIDTDGAYPGLGAEERGQSEALARNILEMAVLPTPIVAIVIGVGGSGGALALGVADRVLMLENSIYSVISPEGCAAILWKDASQRERAAEALKLTAADLLGLKVIDEIIPEPAGGAHTDHDATGEAVREALLRHVGELRKVKPEKLVRRRADKYGAMGAYTEGLMPQTVEVRFKGNRKGLFDWAGEDEQLRMRDAVIVDADRGQDLGRVSAVGETALKKCGSSCGGCASGEAPPGDRPPVLRIASRDEVSAHEELRRSEEDVRRQIIARVRSHNLPMKISDAEWQWDRKKLTVYFTSDKRVDFRNLVRELAGQFKTRIELRQIGVRDEAARLSGVGRCGREYCCSTWLTELSPVNLGLAKDQRLSLNPSQISGGCGRLLCCLKYEHEFYVTTRKRFPKEGRMVLTALGQEKVVAVDLFRERVFLRNAEGTRIVPLLQLKEEVDAAGGSAPPASPAPAARPPRQPAPRPSQPDAGPPPAPKAAPSAPPDEVTPATPRPKRRRRGRRRRGGGGGGGSGGPPKGGS